MWSLKCVRYLNRFCCANLRYEKNIVAKPEIYEDFRVNLGEVLKLEKTDPEIDECDVAISDILGQSYHEEGSPRRIEICEY